jgi:Peptidase family S41
MKALFLVLALDWNADLDHLRSELPKMHANAFHTLSRAEFERELDSMESRSAAMQPHEIVVDLARIVARVGDGHTRLTFPGEGFFQGHSGTAPPKDPSLVFHVLPVRFAIFEEGLMIVRAADPRLAGARVTRIGNLSIDDAIKAVWPVVHGDNDLQKKEIAASYLAMTEVLQARGVVPSREEVPLTLAGGETVILKPGKLESPPARPPFSFKHLPESKAVYFDFVEVANAKDETLAQFAERMFRFLDEGPADKLIIDLRDNWGGNNALNRSILHGIIRSKKLRRPGSLFVLIGRRTFSAAMSLMIDLEKHTSAIFIGEPTGGSPNSYGDSRKLILPESGLTVRISTLYWQSSDPRDKRTSIEPHLSAPPSTSGDAALAAALDYFGGEPAALAGGDWNGVISLDHQRLPLAIRDGKVTAPALKDVVYELRAGTKRLAGTLRTSGGLEFVVAGVRESAADAAPRASERPADSRP